MAVTASPVAEICSQAKRASRVLARLDSRVKDRALLAIADALTGNLDRILAANELDMAAGRERGLASALMDRLLLDEGRVQAIAAAVCEIAALPDPVGEVIEGRRLPNGLDLRKVRVPLGVVAVVYEARPNVTIDAAALCLKAGNAVVLRGSSAALHSNAALAAVAARAVGNAGFPEGAINFLEGRPDHEDLTELATRTESVDLIIPRGGEALKEALKEVATVPVIYAASGNCHIYVDASADPEMAEGIVLNAKVQRPGVCNAAEKLLVEESIAATFVPRIARALQRAGVSLVGDERTREILQSAGGADLPESVQGESVQSAGGADLPEPVLAATEEDWETEYLDLRMAIAIVGCIDEAIEHIGRYGSGHSEAIITEDLARARAFQLGVDAACVYVNASTRFTDGGEFGMGAEIGNSTQKLHARGPIGLRELCTGKYLIEGHGQVRS